MNYPPQQPPGQGMPPQQGYPQQPYQAQPQQYSQQQYAQPQQPQQWGQAPQQSGPQGPQPPRPPVWQSPGVIFGAVAVVAVIVVAGVAVALSGGDDSKSSAAASTTQSAVQTSSSASSGSPSTTRATTTTKATPTKQVSAAAQPIIDALPEALRQSVLKNEVQEKAPLALDTFTVEAQFTITASDSLTSGLLDSDRQRYPMAHIDTDATALLSLWRTVKKDHLSENGPRVIRIDEKFVNGIKLEFLNTSTNLYFVMSGFKDRTSALAFAERAGL